MTEFEAPNIEDVSLKDLFSFGVFPPPLHLAQDPDLENLEGIQGVIKTNSEGTIVKQYLEFKDIGSFLVRAFDDWVDRRIPELLREMFIDLPNGNRIIYDDLEVSKPHISGNNKLTSFFPDYARQNQLTYSISLKAMPYVITPNGRRPILKDKRHIGNVPVMLGSKYCWLHGLDKRDLLRVGEDPSTAKGYFIVEGKEKVIINREKMKTNKMIMYSTKTKQSIKPEVICRITFETVRDTSITNLTLKNEKGLRILKMYLSSINPFAVRVDRKYKRFTPDQKHVNVFHVFKYMSIIENTSDDDVLTYPEIIERYIYPFVAPERRSRVIAELAATVEFMNRQEEPHEVFKQMLGQKLIPMSGGGSKYTKQDLTRTEIRNEMKRIFNRDVFSNLNSYPSEYKLMNLGMMVARMGEYMAGYRDLDDRDSWTNKRLDSAGIMVGQFFKIKWGQLIKKPYEDMMKKVKKIPDDINPENIVNSIHGKDMTEAFIHGFTKKWSIKGLYARTNVVQDLKRDNKLSAISLLGRIDIESTHRERGTATSTRAVQPSQYGFICFVQTPEGGPCGIVKNIAITTELSVGSTFEVERYIIETMTSLRWKPSSKMSMVDAIYRSTKESGKYSRKVLRDMSFEKLFSIMNKLGLKSNSVAYLDVSGGGLSWENAINEDDEEIDAPVLFYLEDTTGRTNTFHVNGKFLGWCDGKRAFDIVYKMKLEKTIPYEISVSRNVYGDVSVYTDNSRPIRPLLTVNEAGDKLMLDVKKLRGKPFDEILTAGAVVYVDPEEQDLSGSIKVASSIQDIENFKKETRDARSDLEKAKSDLDNAIAKSLDASYYEEEYERAKSFYNTMFSRKQYTHCELHPQAILGFSASIIPSPQHNAAARSSYQSGMATQALSIYHSNHMNRFDGKTKLLAFPSNPLVTTEMEEVMGLGVSPQGESVIMAFMSWKGMTGEDSFVFSKRAIDLGLFRMVKYMTYTATISGSSISKNVTIDKLQRPRAFSNDREREKYHAIEDDGLPSIGTKLKEGDVVISIIKHIVETAKEHDISVKLGKGEEGIVDSIRRTEKANKDILITIKLRDVRIPQVGDKFAARNSQKGTISLIEPTELMPFTASGMVPNIIANPHSIPGRMTMSYLIEILTGKVAALTGMRINATPYEKFDLDSFFRLLEMMGYSRTGKEMMYSGITGRPMTVPIYIGPAYFQALRHHVKDKYQARGESGGVRGATRQPQQGKSKAGGLRFGEHFLPKSRCKTAAMSPARWRHIQIAGTSSFLHFHSRN